MMNNLLYNRTKVAVLSLAVLFASCNLEKENFSGKEVVENLDVKSNVDQNLSNVNFENLLEAERQVNEQVKIARQNNYQAGLVKALNMRGGIEQLKGEMEKSIRTFEEALAINLQMKNDSEIAKSYFNLANTYWNLQNKKKAAHNYQLALNALKDSEDQNIEAVVHNNLALLFEEQGDIENSIYHNHKALNLFGKLNDLESTAECYRRLGIWYQKQAQPSYESAQNALNESLKLWKKIGNDQQVATLYIDLGNVAVELTDNAWDNHMNAHIRDAEAYFRQALQIARTIGDAQLEAHALSNLGIINVGNYGVSMNLLNQSFKLAKRLGIAESIAISKNALGYLNLYHERYTEAISHLLMAEQYAQGAELSKTYRYLIECYQATNNRHSARRYQLKLDELAERIQNHSV